MNSQFLKSRLIYISEVLLLIPCYPFLMLAGKNLRKKIIKLPPHSEYLEFLPNTNNPNLLIIGESTAAGVGASHTDTTFAAQMAASMETGNIYNIGKNGLKASGLNVRFQKHKDTLPLSFDTCVILIGANDCFQFTPPSKFSTGLEQFIRELIKTSSCKKIIIPLIPPVHQFPAIPKIIRFFLGFHRKVLGLEVKQIALRYSKVTFIDQNEYYEPAFFAEDGIHPSDLGYKRMSDMILAQIKEKGSQY
ncbi:SGNH/GDSL hydrolase family protein [Belliella aquatica]|nr:SGNH/GDSL hydrolase family protein [Belliella aquatica]MCH7405546.1 SGNH/GDSL hydrolase family protein [Belliella aquatica]